MLVTSIGNGRVRLGNAHGDLTDVTPTAYELSLNTGDRIGGAHSIECKRVRCVETGRVYPSAKAAGDALGMLSFQHKVSSAINGNVMLGGAHWRWVE